MLSAADPGTRGRTIVIKALASGSLTRAVSCNLYYMMMAEL